MSSPEKFCRQLLTIFILSLLFTINACQKNQFPNGEWIDLTYDFSNETIYWPTSEGFELITVFKGPTEKGFFYYSNNYMASEHGGTHIDAPNHFAFDRKTVDEIPLSQLTGAAIVIDVSEKALKDPDYQVSVEDFVSWEKKYGKIKDDSIILLKTGYGKYWPDKKKYLGTSEKGADAVAKLHFPGLGPDAAKWLVENRSINAIGLDTASIDFGQSQYFRTHQILFEQNIPAFENVANLDKLPTKGAYVIALPMKIRGGSGAPLRIVAILPN